MRVPNLDLTLGENEVITFRSCTPEDAHLFPLFGKKISSETCHTLLFEEMDYPIEKIKEAWNAALESKSEFYVGAFNNKNELIGQVYFKLINPNHPWIRHIGKFCIMVLQEQWGKGIGQQLMKIMETNAQFLQATRIEAEVRACNARGLAFYKKQGYAVEGCRKNAAYIQGKAYDEFYIAKIFETI